MAMSFFITFSHAAEWPPAWQRDIRAFISREFQDRIISCDCCESLADPVFQWIGVAVSDGIWLSFRPELPMLNPPGLSSPACAPAHFISTLVLSFVEFDSIQWLMYNPNYGFLCNKLWCWRSREFSLSVSLRLWV
jgi:hypothetical protein